MLNEELEKEFLERTQLWKFLHPAEALLIASGINSLVVIAEYRKKLDEINTELRAYLEEGRYYEIAEDKRVGLFFGIYEYLRKGRDHYGDSTTITLDQVIDLQKTSGANGTCLGVANFFYVLAAMNNLQLLYHYSMDNEHVIPGLDIRERVIYVDHLHEDQFDVEPMEDGVNVSLEYALAMMHGERAQVLETDPYRKQDLLKRALILAPDYVLVYNEIVALHLEYNGDIRIAEHFAKRAIDVDKGRHPVFLASLANVYRHMGRKEEARALTQQVLDRNPDSAYAKGLMEKLV